MPLVNTAFVSPTQITGIWKIDEDEHQLKQLLKDDIHQTRFNEINNLNSRNQHLTGRILIKELSKVLFNDWQGFKYTVKGTPPLIFGYDTGISVSHCNGYAVAIIGANQKQGIDIEPISDRIISLAPRFMNNRELIFANSETNTSTCIWCAKEAIYKFAGIPGLSVRDEINIKEFSGSFNSEQIVFGTFRNSELVKVKVRYFNDYVIATCID